MRMVDVDKAVVARYRFEGQNFEVLVDCDAALELRGGKEIPVDDILAADKVFLDAKKGLLASEAQMQKAFGTADVSEVAEKIIKKGEIQVTAEHRQRLREQKRKKILDMIRRNGVDPKTNLPHPASRLELAFEEAKVKIDEHRRAEDQVEAIVKQLRPILPIRFEKREIAIRIPAEYTGKAYSAVSGFGRLKKDEWLNDGSWACVVEIPAGMQGDLFDHINKITQGNVETKVLKSEEGEQ